MEGQFAMEMAVLSLAGELQRGIQRTRRGKGCPGGFKARLLGELAQVHVSDALSISKDGSSSLLWVPV